MSNIPAQIVTIFQSCVRLSTRGQSCRLATPSLTETEAPEKPTSRQRKIGLFTQPLIRLSATSVRAYLILSQVNSAITNLPSAPLGCALLEI